MRLDKVTAVAAFNELWFFQLHINCKDVDIKGTIEAFMIDTAKYNIESGLTMLQTCAEDYDECHNDETSRIDVELMKVLFTQKNMRNKPEIVDNAL